MSSRHWRSLRAGAVVATLLVGTLLAGCSGGGGSSSGGGLLPATTVQPQSSSVRAPSTIVAYSSNILNSATWLDGKQLPDGAILYTNTEIEPYFANIAAAGLTKVTGQLPQVRAWMNWFVSHMNTTDIWGLGGTVYDYNFDGTETSTKTADSVDSYNATFLTLARQLYDTGDATSRQYVLSIRPALETLANTILKLQQPDGLTIAMPSYSIAYLMDNSEVYRGLSDIAYLENTAFANGTNSARYASAAQNVLSGINSLWVSSNYAWAKGEPNGSLSRSTWKTWYPDATAQLFPILEGVISPSSSRAQSLWNTFNSTYSPQWEGLSNSTTFPWALVADTAAMMNDTSGAISYIQNAQTKYAANNYPWPWYCAEDGWYIRTMNQLQLGITVALADN